MEPLERGIPDRCAAHARTREPAYVGFRLPCWVRILRRNWAAFEAYVPSDEDHYLSVLFLAKQTTGLDALWFRAWYWLYRRWVYQMWFNGQDQRMIEMMKMPPERFYRPDVATITWRRLCHEQARGEPIPARGTAARQATGVAAREAALHR